jgi:hypothetical protein
VNGEKRSVTTGKWFILLVAIGMLALATWGTYKTVCLPDNIPAGSQEGNSHFRLQQSAFSPDSVIVPRA